MPNTSGTDGAYGQYAVIYQRVIAVRCLGLLHCPNASPWNRCVGLETSVRSQHSARMGNTSRGEGEERHSDALESNMQKRDWQR